MNLRQLVLLLAVLPAAASAQCRLCAAPEILAVSETRRPVSIEIETSLDLGKAANVRGGGSIALDERSGGRSVAGLADLGGFSIVGRGRVTGEPLRFVRVDLPTTVRLTAQNGATAEATDLRTDLLPNPQLDASGQLSFAFGGRLVVAGDASGDFRGRIAITADYR